MRPASLPPCRTSGPPDGAGDPRLRRGHPHLSASPGPFLLIPGPPPPCKGLQAPSNLAFTSFDPKGLQQVACIHELGMPRIGYTYRQFLTGLGGSGLWSHEILRRSQQSVLASKSQDTAWYCCGPSQLKVSPEQVKVYDYEYYDIRLLCVQTERQTIMCRQVECAETKNFRPVFTRV